MAFPPALPIGGVAGLRFLDRTFDRQFATFNSSPDVKREVDHFLENAGSITTVDELMGDRQILKVVLGAFGLDDDLGKGAFIRKVVEEGSIEPDAFANKLVEPAYREMAEALGFGNFDGAGTLILDNVRNNIAERFKERQFELAVGDVDLGLRLAMNFRREAPKLVAQSSSAETGWLRLLGSSPLRQVIETALSLPSGFGAIDLDQQVAEISGRAESIFGISDPRQLINSDDLAEVVDRFLANQQIQQGGVATANSATAALTLLQSANIGALGGSNLLASNF